MAKDLEALKNLKAVYWKEVQELSRVESLNSTMVDYIDKVTHTLKSICTIIAMEEGHHHHHEDHDEVKHEDKEGDEEQSRAEKYEELLKKFAEEIREM